MQKDEPCVGKLHGDRGLMQDSMTSADWEGQGEVAALRRCGADACLATATKNFKNKIAVKMTEKSVGVKTELIKPEKNAKKGVKQVIITKRKTKFLTLTDVYLQNR